MRSRLVMILALALAVVAVAVAGSRLVARYTPAHPPAHAALPSALAAYLGVFEPGAPPDFDSITTFSKVAGRQPNLIGYYTGWAAPFDTSYADEIREHGAIPFVQIDPTDASISALANGTYDVYLRSYADSVTLFRDEGADNVTWLWTIQADEAGTGPIQSWWPGPRYVTWVGVDGYYSRPSDTFASVFGTTIEQVRTFARKPVLLSETAVGPAAGQFLEIQNLFRGMTEYETLGLVWFDEHQHGGIARQDWRLEDNKFAEASFRLGVKQYLTPDKPVG